MYTPEEYDIVLNKLRLFFREAKGYIEIDGQKDLSILSACENPHSLVKFKFAGSSYSQPQTSQMRLEHYLLNNPLTAPPNPAAPIPSPSNCCVVLGGGVD